MPTIHIDLTNCYGIGSLKYDLNLNRNGSCLLYAPNGTMKTSFTKTIKQLINGKKPEDSIFKERPTSAEITIDGIAINKDNTYVFDEKKEDGETSISTFLANKELKAEYDDIFEGLNNQWNDLTRAIASISRSSDCGKEIYLTFRQGNKESMFECLERLFNEYFEGKNTAYPLYTFKYNDVFDTNGDGPIKTFISNNQKVINQYFNDYEQLIGNSTLFTSGKDSFGTYHASQLLDSVQDGRFFIAHHKLILRDGTEVEDKESLQNIISSEINKVLTDKKLKKGFDKLEKALQRNTVLRAFKDVITQNPILITKLTDYENFRKEVLLGYIQKNIDQFSSFIDRYRANKPKIALIIQEAKKDVAAWNNIINLFNSRFFVPFKVEIENQKDVILNLDTPALKFTYKEVGGDEKEENIDNLVKVLSVGEQRAFYILENLFEIEARKAIGQETLIILDDVADSFDYKNKYAIVEYLADLISANNFEVIILTHNFDFYRTVSSRLNPDSLLFVIKNKDRVINLYQGIYRTDIISSKFIKKIDQKRQFLALIPFTRNLIEYSDGDESDDYMTLTKCLHKMEDTDIIKMDDIWSIFQRHLFGTKDKTITFGAEKFLDVVFKEADQIMREDNEIELADKLVLSMAIRLKSEHIVSTLLSEIEKKEINPRKNRTGQLVKLVKRYHPDKGELILIMGQVVMFTSENIHFNNFMFEPLVDISILHLKSLYSKVLEYESKRQMAYCSKS